MGTITADPTGTGTTAWTNPTYAYLDDTNKATAVMAAKNTSKAGIWTTFGITDPGGGAVITKVEIGTQHSLSTISSIVATMGREISWDGGSSWGSHAMDETTTETVTETENWVEATSDTAWTWTKLNDTNLQVRITCYQGNDASGFTMSLDVIYVRVTYTVNVSNTSRFLYKIYSGVSGTVRNIYNIRNFATKAASSLYNIRNLVEASYLHSLYNINNYVTSAKSLVYNILEMIGRETTAIYNIFSNVLAGNTVRLIYNIISSVSASRISSYNVRDYVLNTPTNSLYYLTFDIPVGVYTSGHVIYDRLKNKNFAVGSGGITVSEGRYDTCCNLGGSSGNILTSSATMFTCYGVSFWIKFDSTCSEALPTIYTQGTRGASSAHWTLYASNSDDTIYFEYYNGSVPATVSWTSTGFTKDAWHHIVVNVATARTSVELYLDGVSLGSKSLTSASYVGSTTVIWGGATTTTYLFKGLIDEIVARYDTPSVFSAAEISSLYGMRTRGAVKIFVYNMINRITSALHSSYNITSLLLVSLAANSSYSIYNFVSSSSLYIYRVYGLTTGSLKYIYNIRNFVSGATSYRYNIFKFISSVSGYLYGIRKYLTVGRPSTYNIRNFVSFVRGGTYNIRNSVAGNIRAVYHIWNNISGSLRAVYNILGTPFAVLGSSYKIRNYVSSTDVYAYSIRSFISSVRSSTYMIRAFVSSAKTLAYNIRNFVSATNNYVYNILSAIYTVSNILVSSYHLRNLLQRNLLGIYNIRVSITNASKYIYNIRKYVSVSNGYLYNVRNFVAVTTKYVYDLTGALYRLIGSTYNIRNYVSTTDTYSYRIRSFVSGSFKSIYNVRDFVSKTATGIYNLVGSLYRVLSSSYNIRTAVSTEGASVYNIRNFISDSRIYIYNIRNEISAAVLSLYTIRGSISAALISIYNLAPTVTLSKVVQFIYNLFGAEGARSDPFNRLMNELVVHLEDEVATNTLFEDCTVYRHKPKRTPMFFPALSITSEGASSEAMFGGDYTQTATIIVEILFKRDYSRTVLDGTRQIILMKEALAKYYRDKLTAVCNDFASTALKPTDVNITSMTFIPKRRNQTLYGASVTIQFSFKSGDEWMENP